MPIINDQLIQLLETRHALRPEIIHILTGQKNPPKGWKLRIYNTEISDENLKKCCEIRDAWCSANPYVFTPKKEKHKIKKRKKMGIWSPTPPGYVNPNWNNSRDTHMKRATPAQIDVLYTMNFPESETKEWSCKYASEVIGRYIENRKKRGWRRNAS